MKKILTWGTTLLLLLMTGCLMVVEALKPKSEPVKPPKQLANVEVETITLREYHETLTLPSRLEADQSAMISPEISGRLEIWEIDEGGMVEPGQTVARINTDEMEAQLAEMEAQLELDRSDVDFAEREFARVKRLAEREISTDSELDAAEKSLVNAQLSVIQTQRRIDSLKVMLDKAVLRAPFAGRLEKHLIEAGEFVNAGQPLAEIFDLTYLRAIVDVPDRYIPFFETENPAVQKYIEVAMPGARQEITAQVEMPGPQKLTGGTYQGITLDAKIVRVAQASDPLSNTFEVELRLPNPGNALREGIICRSHVSFLTYPDAIVIPLKAIDVTDIGPRVLVVKRHAGRDYAAVRDIEPVSIEEDRILVSKGLQQGDRLLVSGGKGVLDGEQVQVVMENGVLQSKTFDPAMKAADWLRSGVGDRMRTLLERGRESTAENPEEHGS